MISDTVINNFTYSNDGGTDIFKCDNCEGEIPFFCIPSIPETVLAKRLMNCKHYKSTLKHIVTE